MDATNLPGQFDVNQQQLEEANRCNERTVRKGTIVTVREKGLAVLAR